MIAMKKSAFDMVLVTEEAAAELQARLAGQCNGRFHIRTLVPPGDGRNRFHIEFAVASDARAILGGDVRVSTQADTRRPLLRRLRRMAG
jgi:hypothetical protein